MKLTIRRLRPAHRRCKRIESAHPFINIHHFFPFLSIPFKTRKERKTYNRSPRDSPAVANGDSDSAHVEQALHTHRHTFSVSDLVHFHSMIELF